MERRSRQVRSRRKSSRYTLTTGDIDILKTLARYRYLRRPFIALLTDRKPTTLYYSLRKLLDHGLICAPREQRRGYNNLYTPDIFALDQKGIQALKDRGVEEFEITRLMRQKTNGPVKNFAHSMMICDAMASIELGIRDSDCELISWQEIVARADDADPMRLPFTASYTHPKGKYERLETSVVPDGLFGVRYPSGKVAFFALEAEHYNPIEPSTLHRSSFLKKLLAYRDIIKTQVYKEKLKIPNMRVLVVAPTTERVKHMIELTEKVAKQSNLFLFHDVPVQEEMTNAPPPFPELFTASWLRAGLDSITIDSNEKRN